MKNIEKSLINRGVVGDELLDALDICEDILDIGGYVTEDGYALLYHCTDEKSAKEIVKNQYMITKEDCIYMSTHCNKQIAGYGDVVVCLYVELEKLYLDDEFYDELHYKVMTGYKNGINVRAKFKN